jgi:hypothetical protein
VEFLQRQNEYTFFENTHEPYTLKGRVSPGLVEPRQDAAATGDGEL